MKEATITLIVLSLFFATLFGILHGVIAFCEWLAPVAMNSKEAKQSVVAFTGFTVGVLLIFALFEGEKRREKSEPPDSES